MIYVPKMKCISFQYEVIVLKSHNSALLQITRKRQISYGAYLYVMQRSNFMCSEICYGDKTKRVGGSHKHKILYQDMTKLQE